MVAFLFLFAPIVVLIAVLLMQLFQARRDPAKLEVTRPGRVEPQFASAPVPETAASTTDPGGQDFPQPPVDRQEASVITIQR
jgi:hypothetical protein